MAKVATFIYAESITQEKVNMMNEKTQINVPLISLNLEFVPTNYSFAVLCGIVDIDLKVPHYLKLVFKKSDSEKDIFTLETNLPLLTEETLKQVNDDEMIFNVDFRNMALSEFGMYETKVFIDNEEIGTYPIAVRRKK